MARDSVRRRGRLRVVGDTEDDIAPDSVELAEPLPTPVPSRRVEPPRPPPRSRPAPPALEDSMAGLFADEPASAPPPRWDYPLTWSRPGLPRRGQRIGSKYRLVEMLNEGGMGSVWVAHNEDLDVAVAVKLIRSDLREDRDKRLAERLLQEARAAARLGHPAIVRILDFGKTEVGEPYLVMELLEGEDLAMAMEHRGRIDPVKAIRNLLPIAHALATAHLKGIVHRDIKPENIFLTRTEDGLVQPKLIDFGVAKLERPVSERLTHVGTMLGSPGYMSPEQARGDDVDHRADVWSFCVVLYEMIAGRLPFQGRNYNALVRSIIEDEPPEITGFGVADLDLWHILLKGLAKRLEDRWESMRDLGAALASWLLERGEQEDICGSALRSSWLEWQDVAASSDSLDARSASRPSEVALAPPPARLARSAPSAPSARSGPPARSAPSRPSDAPNDAVVSDDWDPLDLDLLDVTPTSVPAPGLDVLGGGIAGVDDATAEAATSERPDSNPALARVAPPSHGPPASRSDRAVLLAIGGAVAGLLAGGVLVWRLAAPTWAARVETAPASTAGAPAPVAPPAPAPTDPPLAPLVEVDAPAGSVAPAVASAVELPAKPVVRTPSRPSWQRGPSPLKAPTY